ncbi:MAG: hypothetical protein P1P88_05555 [Bacteroidales bacterium]|nr:hypothetical protein [Bacteroidales bacterium]
MNPTSAKTRWNFIVLGIFGIAMGFLEAIVVVYLRQIYYPNGFEFPFVMLSPEMLLIEWVREIATLVMLLTIGMLVGKTRLERFFYFIYCFGVWDIIYYVALKIFLDWPTSLLTWDVLFLIPIPWIGPVLPPVICSVTMILFAVIALTLKAKGRVLLLKWFHWGLLILGSLIIIVSFMWDFLMIILKNDFLSQFWTLATNERFLEIVSDYVPTSFNWSLFAIGEILILVTIVHVIYKIGRSEIS